MSVTRNVLWIAPYPADPKAHAAPWITSLAKALSLSGQIKLTILSTSSSISSSTLEFEKDGYRVILLKMLPPKWEIVTLYLFRILALRRWLKNNQMSYDLVHVHGTEHQFELASVGLKRPTVVSIQGILFRYLKALPETFSSKKLIWLLGSVYERWGIRKHKHFVCRTHWDSAAIRSLNPTARIFVGWEMIRTDFFVEEGNNFEEKSNVLFLGGLNSIKGIAEALYVFDAVVQNDDLTLVIFGDGSVKDLNALIQRKQLANLNVGVNVFHKGRASADQIVKEMLNSKMLLHPSYVDNSPNSICEAQVVGLPVVASDVGGVSSLIEHSETGILVSLEVESIIRGIRMLLEDKLLSRSISVQSRKMARERHDTQKVLGEYLNIYNNLIEDAETSF
ncbi:MAG: glycosyltransferase family 4 protein [Imperialibacter sp.]|uniref:glycosyltransferase family 4 protein n=1 Tax=Imperialibacter sp. TaxID=2038411 RepID=UPI003A869B80